MQSRRICRRGVLLAAGLLALAGCAGGRTPATENPSGPAVTAREMSFTPSQVQAKVGQPVIVAFVNAGVVEHDWAILNLPARDVQATAVGPGGTHTNGAGDGSNPTVHVAAMPGQHGAVTFTPDQTGRYTIVCTVPGHKEAGMMGMLTVID
jgi:uncharacterized cupredoxin-like copper-binding protein